MATRAGELPMGPVGAPTTAPSRPRQLTLHPLMLWIIGFASATVLAISSLWYSAHEPEMDFQVYRSGGRHIFGSGLYSSQIEVLGRHLLFTYPPVAALLFWPISHLSVFAGQILWNAINLLALLALIALSVAAARSRRLALSDWRAALLLLTPVALLLYPVRSDLALGQINVLLVLMILADLTTGLSWRGHSFPHGVLVGLAAAVKLTPLVFIPYLVVSRQWRSARNATLTFVIATGALFAVSPHASWSYFTKDAFDVKRVGNGLAVGNQALHASHHQGASFAGADALRPRRSRRALWRGGDRRSGVPAFVTVVGGVGLCGHGPHAFPRLVAPSLRVDRARPALVGGGRGPTGQGRMVGTRRRPGVCRGPAQLGRWLRSAVVPARRRLRSRDPCLHGSGRDDALDEAARASGAANGGRANSSTRLRLR